MRHQIISTLKISALALVLSFGLSYVYAWAVPTLVPPNGNLPTLLDSSTTTQVKLGSLEVQNLIVNGDVKIGGSLEECSEVNKGLIRFSDTSKTMEYCNATQWETLAEVIGLPSFNSYTTDKPVARTNAYFKLSWNTSDATSCAASGAWSGSVATSSFQNMFVSTPGKRTYDLICANVTGSASSSVDVEVRLPIGTMTTYSGTGAAPADIAFDDTNMWTSSYTDSSVTKITPEGAMTHYPVTNPGSLAFDGKNIWASTGFGISNSVIKILSTGESIPYGNIAIMPMIHVEVPPEIVKQGCSELLFGMTYCPQYLYTTLAYALGMYSFFGDIIYDGENLWVAGIDNIIKISSSGVVLARFPVGVYTSGVTTSLQTFAFDKQNIWATQTGLNAVKKISSTGTIITYTGTGLAPVGIAFDGTNMWTANSGDNSVTKIEPDGKMFTYLGTGLSPRGIAFDGTNMWTANSGDNSVTRITPAGVMTTYSGTGAGPGGIAFDGESMWTANYNGNSVTKIQAI